MSEADQAMFDRCYRLELVGFKIVRFWISPTNKIIFQTPKFMGRPEVVRRINQAVSTKWKGMEQISTNQVAVWWQKPPKEKK